MMRVFVAVMLVMMALGCGGSPIPVPAPAAPTLPRVGEWVTRGSLAYCLNGGAVVPADKVSALAQWITPKPDHSIVYVEWAGFNFGVDNVTDDGLGGRLLIGDTTYVPADIAAMDLVTFAPQRWGGLAAFFEVPSDQAGQSIVFEAPAADGSRVAFAITKREKGVEDPCGKHPPGVTPALAVGDEFAVGAYSYRIDSWAARSFVGNQFTGTTAPGGAQIIVVSYSIRNDGNATATILSSDMALRDGGNRTFRPAAAVETALAMEDPSQGFILQELQPGIMMALRAGFLVPDDAVASGLTLVIPAGFGGTDAAVPLR